MKLTSAELKSLYQEGTVRSARGGEDCLTPEAVMRTATGQLSEGERRGVIDHLASCSDCARELHLVFALKPWAEELTASLEPESHSESAGTRLPLRPIEQSLTPPLVLWQRIAAFFSLRPPFARATHLVMLFILLALGFWIVMNRHENSIRMAQLQEQIAAREQELDSVQKELEEMRRNLPETTRGIVQGRSETAVKPYEQEIARLNRTIADLSNPQLDIPIVDLDPGGSVRGGGGPKDAGTLIETPRTANLITLILNFTSRQQYSGFEVEIFDQSGKQIWRGHIAPRSQANSLNLTVARRLLPGGQYQFRLFGRRDGKIEAIADYPVTLRYK